MSTLHTNKGDLYPVLESFLCEHEVVDVFAAFIKYDMLAEVLEMSPGVISRIVVRWRSEDIIAGVSDLSIYELCKSFNITLFRNPQLHAKCFLAMNGDCLVGSANVTSKGLKNEDGSNWELNTNVDKIGFKSRAILDAIVNDSVLVTEDWVDMANSLLPLDYDQSNLGNDLKAHFSKRGLAESFLISALPMSHHPELLWELYTGERILANAEMNAAAHDIALYSLFGDYECAEHFLKILGGMFNSHPFISKLLDWLKDNGSTNYGRVVRWIQNNCTQVPIPRSWDLKQRQVVNILFDWICYFDEAFTWSRPNHSQVIFYNSQDK